MMCMTRRRWILALLLTAAGAFAEESDQVMVTYEVPVGGGRISGVSRSMSWSATHLSDGSSQVSLRIPAGSFKSGHEKFDELVSQALDAEHHPYLEAEGSVRGGKFTGTLTLRGVSSPLSAPVTVVRAGRQLVVNTTFAIDLVQYRIAIPSAGSRVTIDFVARISTDPEAVEAGGALSSN
jgi:polyisoprenoid-binding protein YceI